MIRKTERARFDITPEFVQKKAGKPHSIEDAAKVSEHPKKNTSLFYSNIYDVYFNGIVNQNQGNGNESLATPDILRSEDFFGDQGIETKVTSHRVSQFAIRKTQLAGYLGWMIDRLEGQGMPRQRAPSVEYLLVKYGSRENQMLHRSKDRELVPRLARSTHYAVLAPLNLVVLLAMLSPTAKLHNEDYFLVREGLIGLLRQPNIVKSGETAKDFRKDLLRVVEGKKAKFDFNWQFEGKKDKLAETFKFAGEYLELRTLVGATFPSDKVGDLFCSYNFRKNDGAYEETATYVQPFPIFQFKLGDSEPWLKSLRRNYETILKKGLRVNMAQYEIAREAEKEARKGKEIIREDADETEIGSSRKKTPGPF